MGEHLPPEGLGNETIGPYRLTGSLGAGGMGTVWRAWDERLGRQVAIKQVLAESPPAVRGRLRREARAAARLSHPYIVHVYDLIERPDGDWIVMELVEGRTLRQLLDERGPLEIPRVLQIGLQIAEGLAAAHEQGILHRDLKGGNIMVMPAGHVKILDFGLAKELGGTPEEELSVPGMVIGTCHAMSPEQAQGLPLDARSDLFSLGSLLYEALSGDPPFRGQSPIESLTRVVTFQPRPLQDVRQDIPPELSALIARLLAKEPADRPQSAKELAGALAALAARVAGGGEASSSGLSGPAAFALPLHPASSTTERGLAPPPAIPRAGERRRITVVCCGLVGLDPATGEIRALDLEPLSEAMTAFLDCADAVAEQLGGCLGASLGNILCLYFGFPLFHEDNAERAVRAARRLAQETEEILLAPEAGGHRLGVRIALHTGPAVVEVRPGHPIQLQLGATLDAAIALQSTAPLHEIRASDATRRLLARSFALEKLEPLQMPGTGEPLAVYRVLEAIGPREQEGHLLVGRERELDLLLDRLRITCTGTGQAVMISGEAGIGKSCLLQGMRQATPAGTVTWLIGYGSPYTQSSPLAPVIDLLERSLFGAAPESTGQRITRLEALLRRFDFPLAETVPLLASLLSLPAEGRYPPLALTPQAQRKRTLETVVALLGAQAEIHPLVLVFEDLHWVDPSSLELLDLLLDEISAIPLMLVATFRPELQAPWRHQARVTQISLSRLTDAETQELIGRLSGGRELPSGMRRQITARTDGVPLFIEELTKAVLESEWSGEQPEIPSTLDGSLMARLDRLGDAKQVAQLAAVIGRVFTLELLAAVSQIDEMALRGGLDALVHAELVYRRGAGSRVRYVFKHALIQDTAYLSLLSGHRQKIHARIARYLEQEIAGSPEIEPEILAHHFEKADLPAEATAFLRQSARRALQRSAFQEALAHCLKGIELVARLPRSRETLEQELELRSALGVALMATRGYVSGEVRENAAQSEALCRELGDTSRLLSTLHRRWTYHVLRRDRETSLALAEEIRKLAGDSAADVFIALSVEALTLFYLGDFPRARDLLAKALAAWHPELYPELAQRFGDHCFTPFFYSAWCLWACGRPDAALRQIEEARRALPNVSSTLVFATGLFFETVLWRELRDPEKVLRRAEELIPVCRDNGFPFYLAWATCAHGWALAHTGEPAHGVELVEQGHAALPGTYILTYLLDVYLTAGRIDDGLTAVDKGLAAASAQLDQFYEAELHRLRGELLWRAGDPAGAEEALRRALARARQQGAPSFELRAATDLARLLHGQDRAAEARPILEGIASTFKEGFATRDLIEARELLTL